MKLDARQIAAFLRSPGNCRAVLLYGDDEGLIRERSRALTQAIAGSLSDPFLTVELTRDEWTRIAEEMTSLSMIGGRRVIVVREVADAIHADVSRALRGPGQALLILEAHGLGRGKLRTLMEAHDDAAAIPCYPEEGRALIGTIRSLVASCGSDIDEDAALWLAANFAGDRNVLRNDIEKLALYAGEGGRVTLDLARACSSSGETVGDDSLAQALSGDIAASDTSLEAAIADGASGVALLRMALVHLQKLHLARLRMDLGMPANDAVRSMRPPVFFRAVAATTAALNRWSSDRLLGIIEEARQVELACKQTGSRPEYLVRRFIQSIARRARHQLAS